MRRVQLQGGARRPHARRTSCTFHSEGGFAPLPKPPPRNRCAGKAGARTWNTSTFRSQHCVEWSTSSAGFARATDSWGRLRRGPPRPPPIERRRWALIIALRLDDPLGGQDLALEDPHLDADGAKRRVCLRQPVVDVGADRMQRNPPLAVPLSARDLGAAQPPRARDPDPVRSEPEGGGHRLLHGPPERHALLELQGHVLGHQLGVELRVHDLLDIEVDLLGGAPLDLVLELLHLGALAADDDARARRVDRDPGAVGRALDVDPRDPRVVQRGLDEAPDLDVLVEQAGVPLGGEPPRAPRAGGPQPEPDRMGLLSHGYLRADRAEGVVSSLSTMVRWLVRCLMK